MGLFGKKKNTASNAGGNSYLKIETLKDGAEYTLELTPTLLPSFRAR